MARNWLVILFLTVGSIFVPSVYAAPGITFISDNAGSGIPKFSKFEAKFNVTTTASNLFVPFDSSPPPGINQNGITVNGIFTSPSGKISKQPAFFTREFDVQRKSNLGWYYPLDQTNWVLRFSPNEVGSWSFKIEAIDATGLNISTTRNFQVTASNSKGFVQVAKKDPRYFEFEDGTYFPALGYNLNNNSPQFDPEGMINDLVIMKNNGLQVARLWLTPWSIWSSTWNPWMPIKGTQAGYLYETGLVTNGASGNGADPMSFLALEYSEANGQQNATTWADACRIYANNIQPTSAIKQGVIYRVRVRYKAFDITGPRNSSLPNFGFVVKLQNPNDGNWHTQCFNGGEPQNGVAVKQSGQPVYGKDSASWKIYEGEWTNSQNLDFLPPLYLALENVNNINAVTGNHPFVEIDTVEMQEKLPGGTFGPNIITKPSMEHLTYANERNALAMDKFLNLAEQNDVYFKTVLMEHNDPTQNEIDFSGNKVSWNGNNKNNFYGDYRNMTAVRWYQQAWWRYVQARWGYSPNIFAWEAVNEADVAYTNHYGQTDELGRFMQCGVFGIDVGAPHIDGFKCSILGPNSHMVSTSFYGGYENNLFNSSKYPNVDFGDIHKYETKQSEPTYFYDPALSTFDLSMNYGAKRPNGGNKPVFRGEAGFYDEAQGIYGGNPFGSDFNKGVWLHNYIWGGINPGGLLEQYWITNYGPNVGQVFTGSYDLRNEYGNYFKFIKDVPLNNGNYVDASATFTSPNLRVWGQKDIVNKRAHVWIANKNHTWKNVVDNVSIAPINDGVIISGFSPNTSYKIEWWDTYSGTISKSETLNSNSQGEINLPISNLTSDVAVRIGDYTNISPSVGTGDANSDGGVNALDLMEILKNYIKSALWNLDQYPDSKINAFDFVVVLKRLP